MKRLAVHVAVVVAMPLAFTACGDSIAETPLKDFSISEAVKDARKQQETAARELRKIRARERRARLGERAELEGAIAEARRERREALRAAAE